MPWTEAEATEIARVFVEMFQATPEDVRNSTDPIVVDLRGRVPSLNDRPNPNAMDALRTAMAREFADPSVARRLFDALSWPRPFLLVQRDELLEIRMRRRAVEVAHEITRMVGDAPRDGPESRAQLTAELRRFVPELGMNTGAAVGRLTQAFLRDPRLPNFMIVWTTCRGFARNLETRLLEIDGNRSHFANGGELFGLALSGGGIRSATFCLGVLQRLAEDSLLGKIDMLSTVSGGGYIGAWLAAWIQRSNDLPAVCDQMSPEKHPDPNAEELKPIRMLRRFSNYLTPRLGMFSADTWTMVAVYVRNVLLNLTILVAGFAALLVVPRLLARPWIHRVNDPRWHGGGWWTFFLGLGLLVGAVACAGFNVRRATAREDDYRGSAKGFFSPSGVQWACVTPLLASAYLLSWWLWESIEHNEIGQPNLWGWGLAPGVVFAVAPVGLLQPARSAC